MQLPEVSAFYHKEIDRARREIRALIYNKKCADLMLRLAWNDAGTYDDSMKTGGPNGSIRNPDVYSRDSNKGLKVVIDYCEDIKSRHPAISYADLYQLAGVVAVEITGGPTIDFVPGRKDSAVSPEEDQLPSPKEGVWHLRDKFYRMKLYDRAIVALLGAHPLAHADRSGFDGSLTKEPLKFDNSYFVDLFKKESTGLIKHPTDLALLEDRWFRQFADMYAKNKELFFKDYAEAHKQLSESGFTRRTYLPCETDYISCAIGVAIVVVTFGYMYKFWKK